MRVDITLKHLPRHTGEVPPKGAEGEGRSQIVRPFQIMPFQISSVRLSPSAPYDGAPPPYDAGLSGESLSISEGHLVRGVSLLGFVVMDVGRLVDVSNGFAQEQAGTDQFDEANGRHFEAVVAGGDAQQQIGDHGGEELQSDGIGVASEEGPDLEMLLDPAEQQLDLPARLVEAGDVDGGALEVVGQQSELGSVVAPQANAAHRDGELGIALAHQLDLGIVEDGEAVALGLLDWPPVLGAKAGGLLHAGDEAFASG